jgi:hypothetical protein
MIVAEVIHTSSAGAGLKRGTEWIERARKFLSLAEKLSLRRGSM